MFLERTELRVGKTEGIARLRIRGAGHDLLAGGAGIIVYNNPLGGGDRAADHSRSQDAIYIPPRGFGGGLVPRMDLVAAQRIVSRLDGLSTAPDGTGQFVFDRDAKLLCWHHDGRGDAPAIQIADLSTPTGWSGSEVVVIV